MRQYRIRRVNTRWVAEVRSSIWIFITEWQAIKPRIGNEIFWDRKDEAYATVAHHRYCRNDRDYLDRSSVALA